MKKRATYPVLSAVVFSIQQMWIYRKTYLIMLVFVNIAMGLMPVAAIWLTQHLVNSVTQLVTNGGSPRRAIYYFSAQIFLLLAMYVIQHLTDLNNTKTENLLGKVVQTRILKKINKIPFVSFESPGIYNKIQRAGQNQTIFATITDSLLQLMKSLITVFSVLGYLIHIHWLFIVILLVGIAPLLIIQLKFGYQTYALNMWLTPFGRKEGYVSHLLMNRDSLKEIKLYNLTDLLQGRWEKLYDRTKNSQYQLLKKRTVWTFVAEVIGTLTYAGAGLFAIILIFRSHLKVGSFVAVLHSVQNIQDSLEVASRTISDLYQNSLYVNEYRDFLALDEEDHQMSKEEVQKVETIQARNISFQYPSKSEPSLHYIDLEIPIGKNVTIIGQNGSGKTTLTKCLTGLYDVSGGEILINGKSLKEWDKASYQKRISVLFQDYVQYMFSVKDNIGFGDHKEMENAFKIKQAAFDTGLNKEIERMPYQYETELGNVYENGSQLSGGQWQWLTLSRALFRDSDLILLDEPTASLDPLSEVQILENLYANATDKSIICITHRIGPALLSDEIIVMDHGQITERGTHEELMHRNGTYRKLYETQEKWYRKGEMPV